MDGNLFLLTAGSLRGKTLERVLAEAGGHQFGVSSLSINELQNVKLKDHVNYIILDFPNIDGSANKIISEIKSMQPKAFLIGIHFYQKIKLIQPLMDAGLDGYLLYNPTKTDVKKAMNIIESGQKYLPSELF